MEEFPSHPSSLPHAPFAFLHTQFLCSAPFKSISHRLTRELKNMSHFIYSIPFISSPSGLTKACSPVGLVSLMDGVLHPVIAKAKA